MATLATLVSPPPSSAHRTSRATVAGVVALLALYAGMPWAVRPLERWMAPEIAALAGQITETVLGVLLVILLVRLVGRHRARTRALEQALEQASQGDAMTGLGNASLLARELEIMLGRARRTGEAVSVVLFDIEGLGDVNRRKGALAGDRTLRVLAVVMRSSVRFGTDHAYRVGDDEFAMVLTGDRTAAETVRQRIEWNFLERSPDRSRFNAGVATWDGGSGADRLVEQARRELFTQRQTVAVTRLA